MKTLVVVYKIVVMKKLNEIFLTRLLSQLKINTKSRCFYRFSLYNKAQHAYNTPVQ